MPAIPQKVLDLIETFERNADEYRAADFNEANLRIQFVNPLFKALGWDMDNEQGHAEAYKDVIHEASLKIGGETKAPDYCFRIGGTPKFYLEAKKPAVNIKDDPAPAFQLRRYGWSKKLPLSILTDFEEFAVYDCRYRPSQGDKPSDARIMYLRFHEYPKKWAEIADIFSKDAILKGSFDKYAVSAKAKRGTATVDGAFLEEIETWRFELAKNLAWRNHELTPRQLNYAVQITIDRIIFLRMCEDRGIEPYGQLRGLANPPHPQPLSRGERGETGIYAELAKLFDRADERYNSGLFHFHAEAGREEAPDDWTPKLFIDDKVLKAIIKTLYYPDSPYEFSVIPPEILGQVYEQFLGKVIRLTTSHQAKVEEKPEVKKAGGVYYTPTYIVDYIVKHTVGKLLEPAAQARDSESLACAACSESLTPKQARKLRILDPACGSGSFLLGAYDFLLKWYLARYLADGPGKHKKELAQTANGDWRLTTTERKDILVQNIYGVDIDPQAVEVTKLSLLLKVLEGESQDSLERQLVLFHGERALPDLASNIKCGNSLIGPDFYEAQQPMLFDDEEKYRINVFDWHAAFPHIFPPRRAEPRKGPEADAGFDAVIGNPPYSYRNATEELLRPYYLKHFACAEGNFDLYKFFVERSLSLTHEKGRVGMIISGSFLVQPSFQKLRELLLSISALEYLAPLGPGAFWNATVDTAVLIARKSRGTVDQRINIQVPQRPIDLPTAPIHERAQSDFSKNEGAVFDYRLSDKGAKLVTRLFQDFPTIETAYEFGVGINTGFIRDELVSDRKIDGRYHLMVPGSGISRYGAIRPSGWIMYDREYVKSRGAKGRSLPAEKFLSSEKILVVRTRNLSLPRRVIATIDHSQAYNLNRLSNIIARPGNSLAGLLGFLNSTLFNWLFSTRFFDYEIKPVYLRISPLANSNDERLAAAVQQMLTLHKQLAAAKTPHEQTVLNAQIAAADRHIDRLVYELYGLTADEIKIVEEATA